MRARCLELVDAHQDFLPVDHSIYADRDLADLGVEERIHALFELWDAGTNKDNAERDAYAGQLGKNMHGRIMSVYQTFDYLDNDKYRRIEQLLDIMQETFGFAKEDEPDEEGDTAGNEPGVEMADLPARTQGQDRNAVAPKDTDIPTRSDFGFSQPRATGKSTGKIRVTKED